MAVAAAAVVSEERYPQIVGAAVPKVSVRRRTLRAVVTGAPPFRSGVAANAHADRVALAECRMPSQQVTPLRRVSAIVAALTPVVEKSMSPVSSSSDAGQPVASAL